jgi:haloacid dehalogenase-like hydrolase
MAPVPLPTLTVRQVLASLRLDRLYFEQTTIDTTIAAKEVDKGSGLTALLEWVGLPDAEVSAVGDSEPDLAMFRVARHRYAPSHVSCGRLARLLGCRIARRPFQRGLLEIARSLAHPGGGRCPRCSAAEARWPRGRDLFLDLLQAADRPRASSLLQALLDPKAYGMFVR